MRKPVEEIMVFSSKANAGSSLGLEPVASTMAFAARTRGSPDGGCGTGRDEDLLRPVEPRAAFDVLDLVLLEEEAHALREAICGVAGLLPDLRVIEGGHVDLRAGRLEGRSPVDAERGLIDQGLRWNAADVEADAPGRLLLDDRDGEPELGGSDRADVAAGTGADDDEVVFFFSHDYPPAAKSAKSK